MARSEELRFWHTHLHYGPPKVRMLVVIGERPTTQQRLVGYRPEYILQPGEVTSHADNRLHDATGHFFHGFYKLGTRRMTRSCDDLLGLHKSSRIERKGFGKAANCDRSARNGKAVNGCLKRRPAPDVVHRRVNAQTISRRAHRSRQIVDSSNVNCFVRTPLPRQGQLVIGYRIGVAMTKAILRRAN